MSDDDLSDLSDLFDDVELSTIAAARFAAAGMSIFPVDMRPGERFKQPLYGYLWKHRASSDLATVIDDFVQAELKIGSEFVGIGWALGLDGKCACDLDVSDPPNWWAKLGETALNVTKRGKHLIFDMPDGRRTGNSTDAFPSQDWGEMRGAGGYVIIWWPGDRPGFDVADLERVVVFPHPEWLIDADDAAAGVTDTALDAFKALHATGDMPWRAKGFATALDARPPGSSRNYHAFKIACWIAREVEAGLVGGAEAFGILEAWWADLAASVDLDPDGRPKARKLTKRELQRIERHAVGNLKPGRAAQDRAKAEAELAAHREAKRQEADAMFGSANANAGGDEKGDDEGDEWTEGRSFERVDLTPYLDGTATRIVADICEMTDGRSLLHAGRLNGVHGDSGAGKSWLMAFLMAEQINAGNTIMVVDLEDTPDPTVERLRQLGLADRAIRDRLVFLGPDEAFTEDNVGRIMRQVVEYGVTHIILDSLGEAFSLEGLNEDRDVEVAPWLRRVCRRIIGQTAVGITLIDHGTKSSDKPLDASGSKRKRAAFTGTSWLMVAVTPFDRASGGVAQLRSAKDRHGWFKRGETVGALIMGAVDPLGHSKLRLDPVDRPAGVAPPTPDLDAVCAVLDDMHPQWVPMRAVFAEVRHRGMKRQDSQLRGAVELAVLRDRAEESKGPHGARLFRSKRVP